jgi:hypothetical protein
MTWKNSRFLIHELKRESSGMFPGTRYRFVLAAALSLERNRSAIQLGAVRYFFNNLLAIGIGKF